MERWAIYLAPPRGSALEDLAARWLGRDLDGRARRPPTLPGASRDRWAEMTEAPRHYGFHATLKPPFALAEGTGVDDLTEAAVRFVAKRGPFRIPSLRVATIGRFLALVPSAACPALGTLAGDCVRAFDPFRAPQSTLDLERRRSKGLTPRQEAMLQQWGYPYVLKEFRFHMTLTGPIDDANERTTVGATLAELFAPACDEAMTVDGIALYAQGTRETLFTLRRHLPFGG